jgi:hypothetical protein
LRTSLPRPGRSQDGCRSQLKAKLEAVREFGARRRSLNWNALPTKLNCGGDNGAVRALKSRARVGRQSETRFAAFRPRTAKRAAAPSPLKQSWKEVPRRLRYRFRGSRWKVRAKPLAPINEASVRKNLWRPSQRVYVATSRTFFGSDGGAGMGEPQVRNGVSDKLAARSTRWTAAHSSRPTSVGEPPAVSSRFVRFRLTAIKTEAPTLAAGI